MGAPLISFRFDKVARKNGGNFVSLARIEKSIVFWSYISNSRKIANRIIDSSLRADFPFTVISHLIDLTYGRKYTEVLIVARDIINA